MKRMELLSVVELSRAILGYEEELLNEGGSIKVRMKARRALRKVFKKVTGYDMDKASHVDTED